MQYLPGITDAMELRPASSNLTWFTLRLGTASVISLISSTSPNPRYFRTLYQQCNHFSNFSSSMKDDHATDTLSVDFCGVLGRIPVSSAVNAGPGGWKRWKCGEQILKRTTLEPLPSIRCTYILSSGENIYIDKGCLEHADCIGGRTPELRPLTPGGLTIMHVNQDFTTPRIHQTLKPTRIDMTWVGDILKPPPYLLHMFCDAKGRTVSIVLGGVF